MSATTKNPERLVTISVHGHDVPAHVKYSYAFTHKPPVVNSPVCDLTCDSPVNTKYQLDEHSVKKGWTIVKMEAIDGSALLDSTLAEDKLSLTTHNPHANDTELFRFDFIYENVPDKLNMRHDPQEWNVPH
jgi:hypothetical protein